jgi:isoaspartyl peptidase/L-asparaginase-like protein (Ntn-hydrolase superfamily)
LLLPLLWIATQCGERTGAPDVTSEPATWAGGAEPAGLMVVTHGGVGSPPGWSSDCQAAAVSGAQASGTALDHAVTAVVELEDQPRFNAGTGANIRLDGKTIQMDAAVMTSAGAFGAVAAIERVRNPVLVARAVLGTPHRLLAGDGATRFAHRMGFADVVPTCPEAVEKYRQRLSNLLAGRAEGGYDTFDWRRAWNYPGPPPSAVPDTGVVGATIPDSGTGDTVGAVARAEDGTFAAALSTGGTTYTLYGRVGDVPVYACGCYAGPAGAVACTGFGEEIIRRTMARTVYELLAANRPAREAVRTGVALFDTTYSLGIIAVGRDGWGVAANREMAWGRSGGSPAAD